MRLAQDQSNSGWLSVVNGSSIGDDLRECGDDIVEFLEGYNVCSSKRSSSPNQCYRVALSFQFSATANIENHVVALSTKLSDFEPEKLMALLRSYYTDASIHSPLKETLTFIDARGKKTEVSLTFCYSYEVGHLRLLLYAI